MMNKERFQRVVEEMKRLGLKQILVTDDPSILWLTGRIVNPMERCGAILIKDNGDVHAFMNNLFCFEPIEGMTMHYYADGENPYKLIADELVPGPVGFDKNWASKHTISVLKRETISHTNLVLNQLISVNPVKTKQKEMLFAMLQISTIWLLNLASNISAPILMN